MTITNSKETNITPTYKTGVNYTISTLNKPNPELQNQVVSATELNRVCHYKGEESNRNNLHTGAFTIYSHNNKNFIYNGAYELSTGDSVTVHNTRNSKKECNGTQYTLSGYLLLKNN